jgi:hypothetical protein
MISLNSKNLIFLGAGVLALLAALSLPVLLLRRSPLRNLLLVSPVEDSSYVFDPQKLKSLVEDEFLLTYEVRQRLTVRTAYAEYPVTLIGTNSLYPALTSYPMLGGSFFTAAAEKGKNKETVLNSAAAFRLFGSDTVAGRTLTIGGSPWLVTGVMEDGEEDTPRVYIPAVVGGEGPRSLLVLLDRGLDAAHVKNILMPLGVNETSHLFFDLSARVRLYGERFTLALRVFICALFWIFARRRIALLKALVPAFKTRLKQAYIGELIRQIRREQAGKLLRFALTVPGLAGGAVFCFSLLPQMLAVCLGWGTLTALPGKGDFPAIGAPLWDWYYPDTFVFVLSLTLTGFMPLFESLTAQRIEKAGKPDKAAVAELSAGRPPP